jgi:hypothetical protein
MTSEMGFGKPVDWYQEEDEAVAASKIFIGIVREVLEAGYEIDCVDAWSGAEPSDFSDLRLDLGGMADEEFRFFEKWHFVIGLGR